ncbi:MFS transporter [Microbacterium fluvii]|uniref:MFS transporter n=1 Tax=Microbacterium fluvii TaxID=415215 RepID=A0ABW2HD29_9MICO|nr:MFS transporter [Microbacterium fluvii]MCU4672880.1 MFS transporter [Microbacterium fluvii]
MTTHDAPAKSRVSATFATAYIAVALAQLINALPGALNGTFQAEFHTEGSQLVWITAMFMIPLVVFELTFGVLGDMFGRKRLLQIGGLLAAAGAVTASLAPTVQWMWAAQALNGLGAGILFPISLAMIAAITPDHHARAKAIAAWAGFLSLGAAISPLLAGLTAQFGSWRWSYAISAVAALVVVLVSARAIDSSAPEGRALDIPGQITFALGLTAVLFATVQGAETGWGEPYIIGAYVLGAVLLVAFVLIERKAASPLIHLSLFRNRAFSIAGIVAVVGMFAFLAICFATSIWIGGLQQQEPIFIGILFLFIQGPAFVLIPLVSYLIRHVSPRWVLTIGFAVMAIGGFILSTFDVANQDWTRFIVPLLLVGIGFAFTMGSITAVAINTVPLHYAGMASATTNLLRDLGFALGPVLGGAIAFSVAGSTFGQAFPAVASGAGMPDEAIAQLSHVPPLAFLSSPDIQAALPQDGIGQILGLAVGALGSGFSLVYLVSAICAAAAALLTLVGLRGTHTDAPLTEDEVAEIPEANAEAAADAVAPAGGTPQA